MKNYYYKNQVRSVLIAFVLLFLSNTIYANVNVNATAGTAFTNYATLKDAFNAINAGMSISHELTSHFTGN